MIVLVEPVCNGWVHEEVNAGFLQLIADNFHEDILYIGEREHIQCIRRIFDSPRIRYTVIKKTIRMDEADLYRNVVYYFRLLHKIGIRYRPEKLFILCGYRPCLLASELMSIIHRKLKTYFVLHGMVEEKKGHKQSYMKLFRFSRYCKKLCFITYSPYCTGKYWGIHEDKFVFLHHPYICEKKTIHNTRQKRENDKIIVGIIGACANDKAVKLISSVNRSQGAHKCEFWIASRFGKQFRHMENVTVLDLEFERKEMEVLMRKMDFMLLPYGRDDYEISASGVFWDAIANKVPCLMLDSNYFKYYMSYNIGYQTDTIEGLRKIICEELPHKKEEQELFFDGLDSLERENNETVRRLLQ